MILLGEGVKVVNFLVRLGVILLLLLGVVTVVVDEEVIAVIDLEPGFVGVLLLLLLLLLLIFADGDEADVVAEDTPKWNATGWLKYNYRL